MWIQLSNGSRVKDISYFSRDPKRVIVVDDNVNANEQPENVLVVKPFKNARRVKDTTLLDLIPILEGSDEWIHWRIEIYLEDVEDVRDYIAKLDKTDVVSSYRDLVRMRNENDR